MYGTSNGKYNLQNKTRHGPEVIQERVNFSRQCRTFRAHHKSEHCHGNASATGKVLVRNRVRDKW